MEVLPLKSGLIRPRDSLAEAFVEAASKAHVRLRNGDIVAVASKAVAVAENRLLRISNLKPSEKASRMARKFRLEPSLAQVVLSESDMVIGGVPGALLTIKDGVASANAGVDQKNAPPGFVVLWPRDADASARRFRASLQKRLGRRIGVVVVDSRVAPMRLGTIGLALGCAGFRPVRDFRGEPDLYGRRARITFQAVADGVAGAAHLVMGEARERTPFAVVRRAPVVLDGRGRSGKLGLRDCLYMSQMVHGGAE